MRGECNWALVSDVLNLQVLLPQC